MHNTTCACNDYMYESYVPQHPRRPLRQASRYHRPFVVVNRDGVGKPNERFVPREQQSVVGSDRFSRREMEPGLAAMHGQAASSTDAHRQIAMRHVQTVDVHVIDEPHVPHRVFVAPRQILFVPVRVELCFWDERTKRGVVGPRCVEPILKQ